MTGGCLIQGGSCPRCAIRRTVRLALHLVHLVSNSGARFEVQLAATQVQPLIGLALREASARASDRGRVHQAKYRRASALALRGRSRHSDPLFGEKPVDQMTIPEEPIEGALIIAEHGVARAGIVRSIREVEAALAVVLDRGYQVQLLPQGSVPYDTARASWPAL
jgi:hypothetical protein